MCADVTYARGKSCAKRGMVTEDDEPAAVSSLAEQIRQPNASVAVIFTSSRYDLDKLGPLLKEAFDPCPVIGCTTAGEITPSGYSVRSMTGFTLPGDQVMVQTYFIDSLRDCQSSACEAMVQEGRRNHVEYERHHPGAKQFVLFLIDGLSVLEETVVAQVHRQLGNVPLIGGSAGDDMALRETCVLIDGKFVSNAASISMFSTTLRFRSFKTQHFVPTESRMVITKSDPASRTVSEINGEIAAQEYARMIGMSVDELTPAAFSEYPIMLRIGGEYFVRSIQRLNDDGSFRFFCAIENGLVLTLAKGVNMIENLDQALENVAGDVPNPQLLITCECILRRLEAENKGYTERLNEILTRYNAIGFNSYGEQFNSIHVNQTFTGIAIGST